MTKFAICAWLLAKMVVLGQAPPAHPLRDFSAALEALARTVSPTVVRIETSGYGVAEDGSQGRTSEVSRRHAAGSGVIVDPEGYIVTNAHVLEGSQKVKVTVREVALPAGRRRSVTLNAAIVGVDKETDLAVLKIDRKGLPVLRFSTVMPRQGQIVLAVGNPLGLEDSLTMGVISSMERQVGADDSMAYIQTDAPINPGNSGGPLVDVEGRLVGVNTFIFSQSGGSEGIGFAIPSNVVRGIYRQIRRNGHVHRGEIGAAFQTITEPMAAGLRLPIEHGVIVSDVSPDGPAEKAGLKYKDIVLTLGGAAVETSRQLATGILGQTGESVEIEVLRGTGRIKLTIPVVEKPDNTDRLAEKVSIDKNLIAKLGLLCLTVDQKVVEELPGLRHQYGVVVAARAESIASQDVALLPGDVVHAMNDEVVASVEGFREAIDKLKPGDAVVLEVERPGRTFLLAFEWQ
jgi:serine protease Do